MPRLLENTLPAPRSTSLHAVWLISVGLTCCRGEPSNRNEAFYTGPVNRCSSEPCKGTSRCDVDHDLCAVDGPFAAREFFLDIFVPGDDGVAQRRHALTVSSPPDGAATDITVSRPVTVRSNVKTNSCDARIGVLARVTFTRKDAVIPGLAPPMDIVRATGATKSFEVELVPGVYDIHVHPEGEYRGQVPPTKLTSIAVTEDGTLVDPEENPLTCLVVSTQGPRISGRITRGGVAANGLTVDAVNKQNRPTRSSSTVAVTRCLDESGLSDRCGRFEIIASEPVEDLALRISRPEDPRYPVTVEDLPAPGGDGLRRVNLPALRLPVPLLLTVEDAKGAPVPGATVRFASSSIERGVVISNLRTNELGEIESMEGAPGVTLYPGTYRVDVSPPPPSEPFGEALQPQSLEQLEVTASFEPMQKTVTLSYRRTVRGAVTASGIPVPKARYTIESEEPSSLQPLQSGVTDENGGIPLPAVFESLTVAIRPPDQSRYPWIVRTRVFIDAEDDTPVFELGDPFVREATIRSPDGTPVSGARIDWYTLYEGRPYLVARSVTDASGTAATLLPP